MARRQHGIVTRKDLIEAGLPRHVVDHRVRSGRLRVVHRGVYLLGSSTPDSALMAAALAGGPRTVISHLSAGVKWGILPWLEPPEVVQISAPHCVERRTGIVAHRRRNLRPADRTRLDGIPITTPPRTLVDLAPALSDRELERTVAEAWALGLVTPRALRRAANNGKGRSGAGRFRKILGLGTPARTRSEAEERLLALVRAAGLPEPRVNSRISRYEIDFFWPESHLAVEVDGFAFHASRGSFERDRRRDQELMAEGIRVMRITGRQILDEPGAVLTRLERTLASDQPTGRSPG